MKEVKGILRLFKLDNVITVHKIEGMLRLNVLSWFIILSWITQR